MVVVNTEAQEQEGGQYYETSKMLTLPHANVVIAGRGQNAFVNVLFSLMHMGDCATFDDLEDRMEASLVQSTAYLKTMESQFVRSIYEQEIALVGYSHGRRAMRCIAYQSKDEGGFEAQDIDEAYLSPWSPDWGAPMAVKSAEHARIASTDQIVRGKEVDPAAPLGGRLLLAELTREDCRLSTLDRVKSRL